MRKVAGILMIICGLTTIGSFVGILIVWGFRGGFSGYPDALLLALRLIAIIAAVFFTTGGVFCLKRKYWKICFATSLCLLLFMTYDLYVLIPFPFYFPGVLILPYLPWGILPIIFVCLRKREL